MAWHSFTGTVWTNKFARPRGPCDPLALGEADDKLTEAGKPEELRWGDHERQSKIPYKVLRGHNHVVSSCHFCFEDTMILSGSYDKTVKIWDAATGVNIHDFENSHRGPISECSLTSDSQRVVTSSYDKTIKVWDMERGQVLWSLDQENIILSCKISNDGRFVVCGLDVENSICVIDGKNGKTISYIKDHHDRPITTCNFNFDNVRVASGSSDNTVKIWDVSAQATLVKIQEAHSNIVADCCFTFSGHFLCTASWDKTLKIWDVNAGGFRKEGACVTLMEGHTGSVSSCLFSRDASLIVSGSYDKTITVWDVAGGYKKCILKGHEDWVMDVAISNNRKWVVSASKDTTVRLWNIEKTDQIPMLIKYRKSNDLQIFQCEQCDKLFSLVKFDEELEPGSKCLFCQLASPSRYGLPPSPGDCKDKKVEMEESKM
ncbi:WD repeat-containing protein 88 [Gracilinanus agilis]|uniref:WD repeat-containing protein 88 n=1 Tax=Gracilinanus agilis TaxID=191870 RepID=UPI001CFE9328|nr:WD repeat-containing protein 88 [Gracilinanus agilis]